MKIVVTGADGFLARSLRLKLAEAGEADVTTVTRETDAGGWKSALEKADIVFHLAGVNRVRNESEFASGNGALTASVCSMLAAADRKAAVVLASSTQAAQQNPYGLSKLHAESAVGQYAASTGARGCILRLPNVFGKWAKPNYNSAVATFCHNLARGLPITVHDEAAPIRLVHVDDVVDRLLTLLPPSAATGPVEVEPVYDTTVGEVASMLRSYAGSRESLQVGPVGSGLPRALYSTFVSYIPAERFSYPLRSHQDPRGLFSEILRTRESGQVSFFTALPGTTRGGHYHHTKTEKFVVVHGRARFGFRNLITNESRAVDVHAGEPTVVDTVPGWAHDITNIGDVELVVLLWANELFDAARPDTISARVAL